MPKDTNTIMEGVSITFNSPITLIEKFDKDDNQIKVGGLAVPAEQASRNGGRTYRLEDLHNAKFGGKVYSEGRELTMGLNHSDDVTDNIGRWVPIFTEKGVEFKGVAFNTGKHPYITDMLNKNLLPYVSIEMIADLVKEKDVLYAKNQDILGLDFVKVPGLSSASANIAEAFENAVKKKDTGDTMIEEKTLKEEEEKPVEQPEEKPEEQKEEPKAEEKVEPKEDSLIEKIFDKIDKKVDSLAEEVKNLKEKPQSKGVVTEKDKPEFNLKITDGKRGKDITSEEFTY